MSSRREVVVAHLTQFLNGNYTAGSALGFCDENPMVNLQRFAESESGPEWIVATNILAALINKCNAVAFPSGTTYRVVATLADGRVWYDSSKGSDNTYQNFLNKAINENHNTRRPFMEVLLSDKNYAYEAKLSTTTKKFEERIVMRLGASNLEPLGSIGLSVQTVIA